MSKERINPYQCSHPDFKYSTDRGASPITFVFERAHYKTPTEDQIMDYRRKKEIVEANDGKMKVSCENHVAGRNPPYSVDDIDQIVTIVTSENPSLIYDKQWNGVDCYGFSIGFLENTGAIEG